MSGVIRFERKVFRAGDSVGITIPRELKKAVGIDVGSVVGLYLDDKGRIVVELIGK